jgi:hypothetical protein
MVPDDVLCEYRSLFPASRGVSWLPGAGRKIPFCHQTEAWPGLPDRKGERPGLNARD